MPSLFVESSLCWVPLNFTAVPVNVIGYDFTIGQRCHSYPTFLKLGISSIIITMAFFENSNTLLLAKERKIKTKKGKKKVYYMSSVGVRA